MAEASERNQGDGDKSGGALDAVMALLEQAATPATLGKCARVNRV